MKINDIKTFIGGLIDKNVQVPVLMVGGMGLGKSKIIDQLAKEKGMMLVDLRLAQMESGDIIGMPYKHTDGSTKWAPPEWWPKEGTKGIILLDEMNRAPTDVRQAVFQLVLDRKLHTHVLPEGWFVHSAINPDNGEYQVETLDQAMLRRFCVLTVTPDTDVWLAWAKGSGGISDSVTQFVNANRGLLFHPEEFKVDVKRTPDSYRMLDAMLKAKAVPREHQSEIFRGMIGTEASTALIKWLDAAYNKPVSGTEVLTDYPKVKAKLAKQNTAENYNTVTDLVACVGQKKSLDVTESKNLADYTLNSPKESQTALLAKLPRHIRDTFLQEPRIQKLLLNLLS